MKANFFMFRNSAGFTLLELVIVILVIVILVAVALPQYQKVVEKSRATEGVILIRAILEAQQLYHLANGTYSKDLEELDIQVPGDVSTPKGHALSVRSTKFFDCSAASTGTDESIIAYCSRRGLQGSYYIYALKDKAIRCGWGSGSPGGAKWCKLLTGKTARGSLVKL